MKTTFTLFALTALLFQTASSNPHFNIADTIKDSIQDLRNTGSNLVESIGDDTKSDAPLRNLVCNEGNADTSNILEKAGEIGQKISQNVSDLWHTKVDGIKSKVQAVRDNLSTKLEHIQDTVKRSALKGAEFLLDQISEKTEKLSKNVNQWRDKVNEQKQKDENDVVEGWKKWAKGALDKVSEATNGNANALKEAERLTNDFVSRHSTSLSSCGKELETELDQYESRVKEAVERNHYGLEILIAEVQNCLQDNSTSNCQIDTSEELPKLRNAPTELSELEAEGSSLTETPYQQRPSVKKTIDEARDEGSKVDQQIDEIITQFSCKYAK